MSNLDMSLDDMIKMNKKSRGTGNPRSRPRNSGPGPSRRLPTRNPNRAAPYAIEKVEAPDTTWGHDMFESHAAAYPARSNMVAGNGIETGTKLLISNLDYGVNNDDIKELFSEVGDVKRASIHFDRSGRSKGTAEVVYSRRRDAELAVKRYDNVQLDGKPMKIELVGTNMANAAGAAAASAAASAANGMYGGQNSAPRSENRGGVMGRLTGGSRPARGQGRRGGGGGGRGRGRGRGRDRGGERGEKVSAEDLDADLEKYHAEAMQTN